MRKIAFVLIFVFSGMILFSTACHRKHPGSVEKENIMQSDTGHAHIQFKVYQHDFGNMVEGEIVSYTFDFTNTGTAPLLITSASASCGCTVPKFSKKPVQPGEKGELEVVFNSLGKEGAQHKTIAVRANTNPPVTLLMITASVKGRKK